MQAHVCIGVEGEASFTMRSGKKLAWLCIDPDGAITMTISKNKKEWPESREVQLQEVPRVLKEALEFLGEDYSWLDHEGNPELGGADEASAQV